MPEFLVILVIALIIFGSGKISELGSSVGKALKNFKMSMNELEKHPDDNSRK
ncbi:MAG: twin-arginine translocase TatA/TatE family subunit [Syntrophaceae bacterium]